MLGQAGQQFQGVPLHPKRHRVMPRNWSAEPENRMVGNLQYRVSRYGGTPPPTTMIRGLRQREAFRTTE